MILFNEENKFFRALMKLCTFPQFGVVDDMMLILWMYLLMSNFTSTLTSTCRHEKWISLVLLDKVLHHL